MNTPAIPRFSLVVRVTHWLIAASALVMLISGFAHVMPVHILTGIAFALMLLFHSIYHAVRGEFDMLPHKGDLRESIQTIQAELMHYDEPAHGKFLAEQRLFYVAIGIVALILVVSGFMNKNLHDAGIEPPATAAIVAHMLHLTGAITLIVLVLTHIGVLLLKVNRPLLLAMFTGQVDRSYADARHPNWQYPGKGAQ